MRRETIVKILETMKAEVRLRPCLAEFETAYQVRIAIERIRFAIKHTEQFVPPSPQLREANMELLEALSRLESVDRGFQLRSRISSDRNGV